MSDLAVGGSIAALAGVVSIDCDGKPCVSIEIAGNWVGTLIVRATINGVDVYVPAVSSPTGGAGTSSFTGNGRTLVFAPGAARVTLTASAWTSGTAIVVMRAGLSAATLASGGGGGGGGAITAGDGDIVPLGATTDAGVVTDTTGTVIGFLRGNIIKWVNFLSRFPAALGGTTSAASLPVVLSSDGPFATQTGSVTETPPAADTASSGLNGRLQRIAQRITSLIALFPTALGGTTSANSLPVVLSSDGPFATQTGSITETAPANDTASSGLNGRLQRVAQRLTSLIALVPAALVSGRFDVNIGAAPATLTANSTLQAGTAVVGNAGGIEGIVQATFTRPADTNTYAANDCICNSTSAPAAMTFANAAVRSGQGGFVIGATLFDEANQTLKLNATLHLFSAVPGTLTNDNAALALANADYANYIGTAKFTQASVGNAASGASGSVILTGSLNNPLPYKCAATSLFGVLQADNAYVPVSAEVIICQLNLSQDA